MNSARLYHAVIWEKTPVKPEVTYQTKKNVKDDFHMNCPGSGKQNESTTKVFSNEKKLDEPFRFREAMMKVGLLTFV